ncbi:MAG: amidohydrolase [Rhodospirillales bacterium]|nr:amidohydrolase [Rhodospirillales bacterium]
MTTDSNMAARLARGIEKWQPMLTHWRRDFHRHPESGWMEFRTSAAILCALRERGFTVTSGQAIFAEAARMGLPAPDAFARAYQRALDEGVPRDVIEPMKGGFTGVVGRLKGGRPGPTIGFRFDIDALEVNEADDNEHLPSREGFRSVHPGLMHACGHDGHAAIGLGLAHLLSDVRNDWPGELVFVFQPAEEGTRGAAAMAQAGVVDDCQALLCCHLGAQSRRTGHVVGGISHFLATKKLDIRFRGQESHAALEPEVGRSALLGAATALLNLYTIAQHSEGRARVNVGVLQGGTARNVTASEALLKAEIRGESDTILSFLERRAREIVHAAAVMHGLQHSIDIVGASPGTGSDREAVAAVRHAAAQVAEVQSYDDTRIASASDDAAALMQRVQQRGGIASYIIFGSMLSDGHHRPRFDFDEMSLSIGLKVLSLAAWELANRLDRQAN